MRFFWYDVTLLAALAVAQKQPQINFDINCAHETKLDSPNFYIAILFAKSCTESAFVFTIYKLIYKNILLKVA